MRDNEVIPPVIKLSPSLLCSESVTNLEIINKKIAIENNGEIIISVLYRSHDIKKLISF